MKILHRAIAALLMLSLSSLAGAAGQSWALQVDGLACPFCAYGIEKQLSSIPGVEDTQVDIASGEVIVTMAEGASLVEAVARDKVEDAGSLSSNIAQLIVFTVNKKCL